MNESLASMIQAANSVLIGRGNADEAPLDAARREFAEETGLRLAATQPIRVVWS